MSAYGRVNYQVLIMFYLVAKNSKLFPVDKWRFDKTDPLFCCSVKEQFILVNLLQIKDKFHCQESILLLYIIHYNTPRNPQYRKK